MTLLPLVMAPVTFALLAYKLNWHALATTLLTLAISIAAAFAFDWKHADTLQLVTVWPWISDFGFTFSFGVDAISLCLVLLTTFLMPLAVLGSFAAIQERRREFFFWLLMLESAMLGTFVARDLIFFYICFEFTLIPLFFLIGIFGSTQRLRAARVFFLYTFTGSMLTLAGLLFVAWHATGGSGRWNFDISYLTAAAQQLSYPQQMLVLGALLAGFAVKVPLFPLHTWLPLAHTEAPTAGSVILAGVLLKLGTYGLLRFALPMTPQAIVALAPYIGLIAVIGILYTALICWVQKDLKKLIAYSSVSHLGFCVLGLFALGSNLIGPTGSVLYMINHGLSTGALFLCVGMIYERLHTREMRHMQGLAKVMPVWSFFMVFFCLASVGLPGLNGFVGEFLTLLGAYTSPHTLGQPYAVAAGFGMIFAAIYILYMVGKVVFGPLVLPPADLHAPATTPAGPAHHAAPKDLNFREIVTLAPLAIACLALGLYPQPVIDCLQSPLETLTHPVTSVVQAQMSAQGPVTAVTSEEKNLPDWPSDTSPLANPGDAEHR
ncbi:MAG: NADH-quinone oxidoreductase subunit M [Phycisphaeraceae bacterium]|nr:NADH-quinone oxidoreductase subunit M [Phycisphaeraceae bacterium]